VAEIQGVGVVEIKSSAH